MSNYEHELDFANLMLREATKAYRTYKRTSDITSDVISIDIENCLFCLYGCRARLVSFFDSLYTVYNEFCYVCDKVTSNNSKYACSYYEKGSSELLKVLNKIAHIDGKIKGYIESVKSDAKKVSGSDNYDEEIDGRDLNALI